MASVIQCDICGKLIAKTDKYICLEINHMANIGSNEKYHVIDMCMDCYNVMSFTLMNRGIEANAKKPKSVEEELEEEHG